MTTILPAALIYPIRLSVYAALFGAALFVGAVVASKYALPWSLIAYPAFLLMVPLVAFVKSRRQYVTLRRALFAGGAFGFGVGAPMLAFAIGTLSWNVGDGAWMVFVGGLTTIVAVVAYSGGAAASWYLVVRAFGRVWVQNGTVCPGCAYSLIGNTSMQCPECGRAFTFEELGTTETEFRRRAEGARL